MPSTEPTKEYLDAVANATSNIEEFRDPDVSNLLAYCCWRHDWPFPKSFFESGDAQFSKDDEDKLEDFLETLASFGAEAEGPDATNFAEDGADADEEDYDDGLSDEDIAALAEELDLPDDATEEEIRDALNDYFAEVDSPDLLAEDEDEDTDLAFSEDLASAVADILARDRFNYYFSEVQNLAVPGTPTELAEKLLETELALGPEAAEERLQGYKAVHQAADLAGVTQTILQANAEATGTPGPAEQKIAKFAEENDLPFPEALAKMATTNPKLFGEYWRERNGSS